jgi:methyl-CpG-binding domain protein 4
VRRTSKTALRAIAKRPDGAPAKRIDPAYEYEPQRITSGLHPRSPANRLEPHIAVVPKHAVTPVSPYRLIQELVGNDPWRMFVGAVLQCRTHRRVAHPLAWALFARWPTAADVADADRDELVQLLAPGGLQNRRADTLIDAARHHLAKGLSMATPGMGRYCWESHLVFARGSDRFDPQDVELLRYVAWRRANRRD